MTHKGDRQVAPTGRDGDGCPKLPGGLDSCSGQERRHLVDPSTGRPFDKLRANGLLPLSLAPSLQGEGGFGA
jgi:hypothetical protein